MTIVTSDIYDQFAYLNRPSVFRLNIGIGRQTFRSLFGSLDCLQYASPSTIVARANNHVCPVSGEARMRTQADQRRGQAMNHLLRLVLVSAAPLVIVVATVLAATTPEPENQVNGTIYQYLSAGSASVPPGATIAQAVRAGRPWNFAPAMSHATFGSGVYFHVSQAFDAAYGNSSRALPYPPRDLWCVSLRDAGGASTSVVFVALHEDMYKADWILHESAATLGTPQLDGWLLNIGCGFGMGG